MSNLPFDIPEYIDETQRVSNLRFKIPEYVIKNYTTSF